MNVFVMMECKKKYLPFWVTLPSVALGKGPLCRVLHSTKDPFAERNGHNTRQSWQNGRPENIFSSFAECLEWWHSAKKISKKNKSSLPSAFRVDARQRIFQKKIKNICRVPEGLALGKEFFFKKIKNLCRVPAGLTLGKATVNGAGAVMVAFLCQVPRGSRQSLC